VRGSRVHLCTALHLTPLTSWSALASCEELPQSLLSWPLVSDATKATVSPGSPLTSLRVEFGSTPASAVYFRRHLDRLVAPSREPLGALMHPTTYGHPGGGASSTKKTR
jgi:hypothetical protein